MRSSLKDAIEHHACPEHVVEELRLAGGANRFGEPNFRVVWGWDRLVQMSGEWQEFEQFVARLTDKTTGYSEARTITKLKSSVVETRTVPKYLPGNCWHLESWRPPEDYGSPEMWSKLGEEVIGKMTIDTSGPYPYQGEYELCYPLTGDGTSHGTPIPLVGSVVSDICQMIRASKERFTYLQRRAAIEQRLRREDDGFVEKAVDKMKDGMRPFAGEKFVSVPADWGKL